jgi:deoxyribodipyrimidine photo-lyase
VLPSVGESPVPTFIVEDVPENQRRAEELGAGYTFYLRKTRRDANDMLCTLASKAAAVVTDDCPAYIPHEFNESVRDTISVPYHPVDPSCIVPMEEIGKQEYAAYTIRPKIHRLRDEYLQPVPRIHLKRKFTTGAPAFH